MAEADPRFLRACRREPVDRTPVWFMRQAGRYMEEYRKLRQRHTLLELCRNPELAAEVTMQPIRRFDLDAAIIFADILLPLPGMGVDFEFAAGEGPRILSPVRSEADVDSLRVADPQEHLGFVLDSLALVRTLLPPHIALIGFAGAPFTLASYMIEGGHSRHFAATKNLMYAGPQSWHRLMDKIATTTIAYLRAQAAAGAQALQLFDSWVGALGPDDYAEFVLPYNRRIFEGLADLGVPLINFSTGTASYLDRVASAGGSVVSIDWRIRLDQAWEAVGYDRAIQGNLDPLLMMAPLPVLSRRVEDILTQAAGRPGHIFNLGHGFLPQTPVDHVEAVVTRVHEFKA